MSFDGKLVIGRRSHIELWDANGKEMISSYYHPYMFSLHEIHQYKNMFLIAACGIDVVYLLDQDCNINWSWWAHQENFCPPIAELQSEHWQILQTTEQEYPFLKNIAHLNSVRIHGDNLLISLLKCNSILKLPIMGSKSEVVAKTTHGVHSPIITSNGSLIYGLEKGMMINDNKVNNYEWPKRIYEVDNLLFFTHETGVTQSDLTGSHLVMQPLPRPFGLALLEPGKTPIVKRRAAKRQIKRMPRPGR